jgi:hypothetical protein
MLTVAVGLLVVDGLATCWLVLRRRRAQRARMGVHRPAAAAQDVAPVTTGRTNDELERLESLRVQWGISLETPRPDGTVPVPPPAPLGVFSELRRAADLLAATKQVIYDPAIWEA